MNRRNFLTMLATATTTGVTTQAIAAPAVALGRPAPAHASIKAFDLDELTVGQLQSGMQSGKFTALSLTKKYLARIAALDRQGPKLGAVIEINPDALEIARGLDRERKKSGPRGPLHGIPVLIKDNIGSADRMSTTAGSLALCGSVPSQDAGVVHRLRQAGAVILGKTNLSEWANFRSSRSTSGWSGRGGLTRNPYVLDRNASGSSSGSAVAVAANLCAVAVGTETDGSIVSPSSVNGIVGIKPTLGLVSRSGIIPIAHSQDTAGPMARTVTDAALLLGALAGPDPRDSATAASAGKGYDDYTRFLNADGLRGARIGVARKFDVHPEAAKQVEQGLEAMRRLGAILIDPADLPTHGQFGDLEMEVLLYEFKADLNAYLGALPSGAPVRSLTELIKFNEGHAPEEMPFFGQELLQRAEKKGPLTEQAYQDALEKCRRLSRDQGIDALMNQHQLDAIVAPTSGPAHVTDLLLGDRDIGGSSEPAAVAGYPHITIPIGNVSGLPVGLSFFGRPYSEPTLLKLAFALEQATKARRAPRFLPTIEASAGAT